MMECFENYFGKYPFWKDGYALVETSYLGMEHQSAIAYGNNFLPGYNGNISHIDNLDFDFIIAIKPKIIEIGNSRYERKDGFL